MAKRVLFSGKLHPCDEKPGGVQGCTFTVEVDPWDDSLPAEVTVRSPYGDGKEVVVSTVCPVSEVARFLIDHSDY